MRRPTFLTPVLSAIFACGPGKGAGTDSETSTGVTSSTADPTTGSTTGTTTSSSTGPTSAATTTSSSSTGTSTGDTSTGDPGNVQYAAFYVPGGLDRIVVRKADFDADLCTSVVFVWPEQNIQPDLFIPDMWSYQDAQIAQGTAGCLEFMGWLPDAEFALDISGSVDWPWPMLCPGTLDIDATLLFPQAMPWVPAQDTLSAVDLPLQGC